jgi:Ca-activated chloride channel family protein
MDGKAGEQAGRQAVWRCGERYGAIKSIRPMKNAVSRIVRPAVSLACLVCCAAALAAQTAASADPPAAKKAAAAATQPSRSGSGGADNGQFTITQNVNEVYLVFSVTDSHGRFISNLRLSDFALLDDHRAPEKVYSFTQQTNLPLRVGILIDTSSSIRQRFEYEQQAAKAFLLQVIRPQSDQAFVEGFDVSPDYRQGWTNNLDSLAAGIDSLQPGGGTALYDAVYSACRDKLLTSRGQEPVRKVIVLISDGDDDQSHAYLDDAIKECQRADTNIYAISTNASPSRDKGDDVLNKMALATGGKAFFPTTVEDMPVSFEQIQKELRSQYALVYKPADFKLDGSFRPIYLFCLDRRYKVRAMQGYFAPKG